jgi:hypothetical protein
VLRQLKTPQLFHEQCPRSVDAAALEERERLLRSKISELGLRVEGSRLEPLVQQLHHELAQAGIAFKPRVYLSDEWGCPDGVPLIGAPFYLADERLSLLQKELLGAIEAESDEEILAYLRHEAGHALNYAYRLYETEEWHSLFGPYSRPYLEDYRPDPFSRSFVRHIPGWYAQKHPDEDFAETFAVWLAPDSDWRHKYEGWSCLKKLEYVERTMRRIGPTLPILGELGYDESGELARPLSEYFERFGYRRQELPLYFDGDLKELFYQGRERAGHEAEPARAFIDEQRSVLSAAVGYWTGLDEHVIRSLLEHFSERAQALDLWLPGAERARLASELAVVITALCMNRLYRGDFVSK